MYAGNSRNAMRIAVRQQGTTITIELTGEWDLTGRTAARQAIARALAGRPECVLLDLTRLEFIDAIGLHVTTELAQRSAVQNVRLVIIPGPPAVQRVFELTGASERLPFIDEQRTACSSTTPRNDRADTRVLSTSLAPTGAGRRTPHGGRRHAARRPTSDRS